MTVNEFNVQAAEAVMDGLWWIVATICATAIWFKYVNIDLQSAKMLKEMKEREQDLQARRDNADRRD